MSGRQQSRSGNIKLLFAKPKAFKQLHLRAWGLIALAAVSTMIGFEVGRFRHDPQWGREDLVHAASLRDISVSDPAAVNPDIANLRLLPPQEQAQQLLERAVHHDFESLDFINKNVDAWRGHLQDTDNLSELVHSALNSNDLRVRAAAIEVDLAANNLVKSPESVSRLVKHLRDNPADRPWTLWRLGALGNRGVQPDAVLAQLRTFAHDRNEETRYWAVEGLAILGTDETIDPLLDRFAHDSSSRVRKRAACNLAASGMLTKEQRITAVPQLLNFFDDDALDSTTRSWVYGALRLITGAELGNDSNAWRQWWANRTTAHKKPVLHNQVLFA